MARTREFDPIRSVKLMIRTNKREQRRLEFRQRQAEKQRRSTRDVQAYNEVTRQILTEKNALQSQAAELEKVMKRLRQIGY